MALPTMNAEAALYRTSNSYHTTGTGAGPSQGAGVVPQQCASTGCITLGGGRVCLSLPIVGRVCVNIPQFGSWNIRCCLRFGWPPVRCTVSSC
jgi:hypothetical protein